MTIKLVSLVSDRCLGASLCQQERAVMSARSSSGSTGREPGRGPVESRGEGRGRLRPSGGYRVLRSFQGKLLSALLLDGFSSLLSSFSEWDEGGPRECRCWRTKVCRATRSRVDVGARLVANWPTVRGLGVDGRDGQAIDHRVGFTSSASPSQEKRTATNSDPRAGQSTDSRQAKISTACITQ